MKALVILLSLFKLGSSFQSVSSTRKAPTSRLSPYSADTTSSIMATTHAPFANRGTTALKSNGDDNGPLFFVGSESDQSLIGAAGVVASAIVLFSEYTLKSTGCGLPAGPAGLFGAAEGVSYLFVVGLAGYSILKKVKTGSGLPAGPGGILGAAEGLSFLAILVGLVVLGFQIADYGYIPNAVPMDGGMCS